MTTASQQERAAAALRTAVHDSGMQRAANCSDASQKGAALPGHSGDAGTPAGVLQSWSAAKVFGQAGITKNRQLHEPSYSSPLLERTYASAELPGHSEEAGTSAAVLQRIWAGGDAG